MPRPWRIRYAGAKYHVTSRGNGGQAIFHTDEDHERFIEQLEGAAEQDNVVVYAYCLMPNHFHLLIETPRGNVQKFMQRLNTAYSMYHRYKHHRPGHCLQGRYGAKVAGGDEYLVRLTRYIHLNPVKTEAGRRMTAAERIATLNRYRWSSLPGYVDVKHAEHWIDYRWLKLMGCRTARGNRQAYRRYIETMAAGEAADAPLEKAKQGSRYAIGEEDFRDEVEERLRQAEMRTRLTGDVAWPEKEAVRLDGVEAAIAKEYRLPLGALHGRSSSAAEAKKVAIELACRHCGLTQREIGRHFGYRSESAVGKQRAALRRLPADSAAAQRLAKLERMIIRG